LHELATNAVKYGALSNQTGTVEIGWQVAPGPSAAVIMQWRERGGPKVVPPTRQGFGSRLIERTFGDSTTLDYAPDGFACTMQLTIEPA
jgi:two-component sensor histidine kinase